MNRTRHLIRTVTYLATQHLLQLGHRHIAFVGLDPAAAHGFTCAVDRHQGFTRALTEAGLPTNPALVKTTGFAAEAGAAALIELLTDVEGNARGLPTAVVAVSDEVAMGVLHAARRAGISVPHELSVIGVDDHDLSYLFDLTTIGQPAREQGRVAAAMLLEQIRRRDRTHPQLISTRPELIHRNSTAPPRKQFPFSRREPPERTGSGAAGAISMSGKRTRSSGRIPAGLMALPHEHPKYVSVY